jgi:hypothetical protein
VTSRLSEAGSTKYETITYEVTNPSSDRELFMPQVQSLLADRQSYSPDREATQAIGQSLTPRVIGSRQTVRGEIAFALPQAATIRAVEFTNTEGIGWRVNAS